MVVVKKKKKEKAGEGGWALSSSIADQVSPAGAALSGSCGRSQSQGGAGTRRVSSDQQVGGHQGREGPPQTDFPKKPQEASWHSPMSHKDQGRLLGG